MRTKARVFTGATAATLCGYVLLLAGGTAVEPGPAVSSLQVGSGGRMLLAAGGFVSDDGSVKQVRSTNWSGYAQSTHSRGTFSAIEDTWIVPKVATGPGHQYASDWVGIGGFTDGTLVQAGISEWNAEGSAKYIAWTEILPHSGMTIQGLEISPGDKIKTIVEETSANRWSMMVYDLTTGKSGGRTVSYSSSGSSAETIHERPVVKGRVSTLANTTNVTFNPGRYSTSHPGTPSWRPLLGSAPDGSKLYQTFMANNLGTETFASPSLPSSSDKGFTVAYGATSPPPPS